MGLMTLIFELGGDFCALHLSTKFRHPMFNRSEVIVLTNKQTNKNEDILSKTSTSLLYATLVEKYSPHLILHCYIEAYKIYIWA